MNGLWTKKFRLIVLRDRSGEPGHEILQCSSSFLLRERETGRRIATGNIIYMSNQHIGETPLGTGKTWYHCLDLDGFKARFHSQYLTLVTRHIAI
jgi:hypothetical protein